MLWVYINDNAINFDLELVCIQYYLYNLRYIYLIHSLKKNVTFDSNSCCFLFLSNTTLHLITLLFYFAPLSFIHWLQSNLLSLFTPCPLLSSLFSPLLSSFLSSPLLCPPLLYSPLLSSPLLSSPLSPRFFSPLVSLLFPLSLFPLLSILLSISLSLFPTFSSLIFFLVFIFKL